MLSPLCKRQNWKLMHRSRFCLSNLLFPFVRYQWNAVNYKNVICVYSFQVISARLKWTRIRGRLYPASELIQWTPSFLRKRSTLPIYACVFVVLCSFALFILASTLPTTSCLFAVTICAFNWYVILPSEPGRSDVLCATTFIAFKCRSVYQDLGWYHEKPETPSEKHAESCWFIIPLLRCM